MKNEKQTYTAPELTELGDVQALTQGDGLQTTDGGMTSTEAAPRDFGESLSSLPLWEGFFAFNTPAELNAVRARRDIASKAPAPPSYPKRDDGF